MNNGWFVTAFIALLIGGMIWAMQGFSDDCKAHGGAHVTYPYKTWPECWSEDGRRIFW